MFKKCGRNLVCPARFSVIVDFLCNRRLCLSGDKLLRILCCRVTETHALAAANQQKNDRLRAAFGISNDYVDGSSFQSDRKEKEKEKREQERLERERQQQQKYT